jgi:putative nucleotidyltransferase with HDIG domain
MIPRTDSIKDPVKARLLLITDDPDRSADLARNLDPRVPCQIHNLCTETVPVERATALVTDVSDLGPVTVERLRSLLAQTRHGVPLVVLLHRDTPHARLQALALGASQTLSAPFDLSLVQPVLNGPDVLPDPPSVCAKRHAEAARSFYGAVFVPHRPITPADVDNGTDLVEQSIREVGIRDWIQVVREFDDATHQHCLLVAGLAAAFAAHLGLGPSECHRVTKAALLHDVGKIHVPAAILNKPGKLDPSEMALVRLHPEKGAAMLAGQGFAPELLSVVRSHHEMLDGSGYPDGLAGDAIPDLVRLVTICDIYGALIEHRSYKPPMATGTAYEILRGMEGRLDQDLVTTFHPVTTFEPRFSHHACRELAWKKPEPASSLDFNRSHAQ